MSASLPAIKSKEQFDALIASGKVIFVDFYADWCEPCKAISPVFQELAKAHVKEGVEFYKLDIDEVEEVATELGIRSIPTFHVYKDGGRLDQLVGASRPGLTSFVETRSVL